jgi:predicted transcriptional regulator
MKDSSFFVVQGWMVNCLKLKSNELLIFAIIYGFSKDNQGKFDGSLKYLSEASGISKNTVINSLNSLVEKEFIIKENITINNITFCKYYQNDMVVQNLVGGYTNFCDLGGANFGTNNILNNNIEDKKQILFSDSFFNSYDNLRNLLKDNEDFKKNYAGVDLKHYIEDVLLWSDSKNQKRTNKGWLATLRNWMKRDLQAGKLVHKKDYKKQGHTNY